jgi:hypothetical protein
VFAKVATRLDRFNVYVSDEEDDAKEMEAIETSIKSSEAIFYILTWFISAMAGISRQLSLVDRITCRNVFAVGVNSGFLGFAVVAFSIRVGGGYVGTEFYYLGIAAVVGLAGKEQEQIVSILWARIVGNKNAKDD